MSNIRKPKNLKRSIDYILIERISSRAMPVKNCYLLYITNRNNRSITISFAQRSHSQTLDVDGEERVFLMSNCVHVYVCVIFMFENDTPH